MGRFLFVRLATVAALVLLVSGLAMGQTQSNPGIVNLTFTVPAHIELVVNQDTVSIGAWDFYESGLNIDTVTFGDPALIATASVEDHLTVHSNVASWALTYAFDPSDFTANGGYIVIKLTHKVADEPSVVFTNLAGGQNSYNAGGNGQGTTHMDAEYNVIAPVASDVEIGQEYTVVVTYTITG